MRLKIENLLNKKSKVWLAEELDMTRATLDKRLELQNWRKLEIKALKRLFINLKNSETK